MKEIDISVCPSFACNMRCKFCYLERHSNKMLDLTVLKRTLETNRIRYLDVYGGEITVLPHNYADELVSAVRPYNPSYVTNGLVLPDFWIDVFRSTNVAFSLDLDRELQDDVKKNILRYDQLGSSYSVITIDINRPDYAFLEQLKNLQSVSIKPYSPAPHTLIKEPMMLDILVEMRTSYPRLFDMVEIPSARRDDCSHCFLLPDGKLYDIGYEHGRERFVQFPYTETICDSCLKCEFYKRCFNEHYAGYLPSHDSCIGRKNAMEYLKGLNRL